MRVQDKIILKKINKTEDLARKNTVGEGQALLVLDESSRERKDE